MPAPAAADWMARMEPTAPAALEQPPTGRFTRSLTEPAPAPEAALAPPADLAAMRAIERRWPRSVPPKRVFPRS